jgi:hypothetical protein
MGQLALDRTLALVRQLSPTELREVEREVKNMLVAEAAPTEADRLDAALLASGLVARIPDRPPAVSRDRALAHITGGPLSQAVIEDRR